MSVKFVDATIGSPRLTGKYVCWVNPEIDVPAAQTLMLTWMFDQWNYPGSDARYRGVIYGYAGPIPALRLDSKNQPGSAS